MMSFFNFLFILDNKREYLLYIFDVTELAEADRSLFRREIKKSLNRLCRLCKEIKVISGFFDPGKKD